MTGYVVTNNVPKWQLILVQSFSICYYYFYFIKLLFTFMKNNIWIYLEGFVSNTVILTLILI